MLLVASLVFPALSMRARDPGDTPLYFGWARKILEGSVPYRDFTVEYPPYALFWFLVPGGIKNAASYGLAFAAELLLLDVAIKVLLLREARKLSPWFALVPFLIVAADGFIQDSLYLKRFDLIPAAMTFVAVLLLSRGAVLSTGVLLAVATLTKVYPALLVPIAVAWAVREDKVGRLVQGIGLGLIPVLVMMIAGMPWWKFFAYHQERGLQVESFAASFLWLAHVVAAVPAKWGFGHGSYEVSGTVAEHLLPLAKALWGVAVMTSVAVSTWRVRRGYDDLARAALLPILAFVAFNYVLSPQYMIWLMCLVALALVRGWSWPLVAICGALGLTQLIFGNDYWSGLHLPMTLVLCTRNVLLVLAWAGLLRELLPRRPAAKTVHAE